MHQPVMLEEVLRFLNVKENGVYIDCTVGGGGHAAAVAERAGAKGAVLGLDLDRDALERARKRLAAFGPAVKLVHGNFAEVAALARRHGLEKADGVLFDLGVSSEQLEDGSRGFSFLRDGPLDMRMDRSGGPTALDILLAAGERELEALFRAGGERRRAGMIARKIARLKSEKRSLPSGTAALAALISSKPACGRRHPATLAFQALRIAVNKELENLEAGLESAFGILRRGGRLVVISYHSLEDGIVKECFKRHAGRWESLPQGGRRLEQCRPAALILTPRPVTPSETEVKSNPRARSGKLRCAEKTED